MFTRFINCQCIEVFRSCARRVGPLTLAWILSLAIIIPSLGCSREPPDLSDCTRIEVHYIDGALNHFIPDRDAQNSLLSEDERRYVKSFDTWTVTDQQLIKAFAYDVAQGTYRCNLGDAYSPGVPVECYRGSERIASFTVHQDDIVTADRNEFTYSPWMPDLAILAPPGVKPLEARWNCVMNMSKLVFEGLSRRPGRVYPDPNRWCDDFVEYQRSRQYPDIYFARAFACPSIHVSSKASDVRAVRARQKVLILRSDYAMNPHCWKESPGDTVYLFETKAGWNQHGGPELFTFDNHDPKGGCVLLNDGTVKFIRTKEELKQLRWK
jgi:hypothetical protein